MGGKARDEFVWLVKMVYEDVDAGFNISDWMTAMETTKLLIHGLVKWE